MASLDVRPRSRAALSIAALGLLISFWSIWPWAQRLGDPTQSVYAGPVGDRRTQVLVFGLVIAGLGVAVHRSAPRLLLAVAAIVAAGALLAARGVIRDVSALTEGDSEIQSEVGWALYAIEATAILVVVAVVIVGIRSARRANDDQVVP